MGIAAAIRLTPERLSFFLVGLAGLIALWNAVTYPSGAGYDATSHREYGDFLISHLGLPHAKRLLKAVRVHCPHAHLIELRGPRKAGQVSALLINTAVN